MDSGIDTITFRITGTRPLLLHNPIPFLDPFNEMLREMKRLTAKGKKKTDDDHRRISELEFHMGLYTDDDGGVIIPAAMVEAVARDGATIERKGTTLRAAVTVLEDSPLLDASGRQYKDPEKLWKAGEKHVHKASVVVQRNRVLRTRPIFFEWQIVTTLTYLPSAINKQTIIDAVSAAGILKCMGDGRPRFGSFVSEVVG